MILLHKSDPYLAKKHTEYLRCMRKKRKEEKEKTFYERMQEDIRKREEAIAKANKIREEREKHHSTTDQSTTRRGTMYRMPTGLSHISKQGAIHTSSNNTPVNSLSNKTSSNLVKNFKPR